MATTQTPTTPDPTGERHEAGRRHRRTAAVVAVAAACVVAIASPFVLHSGHHPRRPATPPAARVPHVPAGSLTGDVDADGLSDTVSISHRGLLRVALGSGTTVRQLLPAGTRLQGLVRVGTPGLDVVTSAPTRRATSGGSWSVLHLQGVSLSSVRMRHHASIGTVPDSLVAWVSHRTLYDGVLDDLQKGKDRVAVLSRSWALRGGGLAPTRAGVRCWDRTSGRSPARCAPGQDWTPDVGPHGDLPALQPIGATWFEGATAPVVDGSDSWTLRRATPPGPAEAPHMDLVLHTAHGTASVRVPTGWIPVLRPRPVTFGSVHGVLISQEGGDSDTWRVYVDRDGRPVQLRSRASRFELGGGFTQDTGAAYVSWVSDAGPLFTRVGTPRVGRYRLYQWVPVAGTTTSPPALQAQDLGIVCFDDLYGHYGTCAS